MSALKIVLLLLELANKLFDYFQQQKWIKEGEDRIIAAAAQKLWQRTEHAKLIHSKIDQMDDKEVEDLLNKLAQPLDTPGVRNNEAGRKSGGGVHG